MWSSTEDADDIKGGWGYSLNWTDSTYNTALTNAEETYRKAP